MDACLVQTLSILYGFQFPGVGILAGFSPRWLSQLRAEAEHMMKQADNRQRTPPVSTARNAPPKTESCSTTYSSSGGFMKNLTGLFGFSGSTASAAAAASMSRSVGQPPASAKSQSYTNEGADQDFQRRRAEAEHRRRRDQERTCCSPCSPAVGLSSSEACVVCWRSRVLCPTHG